MRDVRSCVDEAGRLIETLRLEPHPEGGHYRQTWAGPVRDGRPSGTAILFLLRAGERSHWHRVDADEIWLFHAGAPLTLSISADGERASELTLGPDVLGSQRPQVVVAAGAWQAAQSTGDWTLVSCTVSPGFTFAGFELAPPEFDIPGA